MPSIRLDEGLSLHCAVINNLSMNAARSNPARSSTT